MKDEIYKLILKNVRSANAPLETKEVILLVQKKIPSATRTKIFYRLTNLRGEGILKGKFVGPGKGCWIWWETGIFDRGASS